MGTYTDANPTPLDPTGWKQTFFDGFNGTTLDRSKWSILYDNGRSDNGAFFWESDNIDVGGGEVTISATRGANDTWYAGGMSTGSWPGMPSNMGFSQQYGRYEFRAAAEKGQGMTPGLILWPTAGDRWLPEIDILEAPEAGRNKAWFTHHWQGTDGHRQKSAAIDIDVTQWHTYTVDILPGKMTYYIDGVKRYETTEGLPAEKLSIALQMYVFPDGTSWSNGGPNATTPDTVKFHVDWVKAWTYDPNAAPTPTPTQTPTPTPTEPVPTTPGPRPVTTKTFTGTAGADSLVATAGNDFVDGKAGNDKIWGWGGSDVLTGGTGKDIFVFDTKLASSNVDVIVDFNAADDMIHLDNWVFTNLNWAQLSAGSFVVGEKALDSSDRIIYNNKTGALSYDADGIGSTMAVKFAVVENLAKLSAANFLVF